MANITKRGNSYRIQVYTGRDKDGNVLKEYATFRPDPDKTEKQNQKALQAFAVEFEKKVQNGLYLDGEKLTFREFTEIWIREYAKVRLAVTTLYRYQDNLDRYILPEIGSIKMAKIQPRVLNRLFNKLSERGIAPSSIRHVRSVISSIFSTAVKWNVCTDNPCRRTDPPRKEYAEDVKHYTLEQAATLLAVLDKPMQCPRKAHNRIDDTGKPYHVDSYIELQPIALKYKVFIYMALFIGARRGELVPLRWDDIDFEGRTLTIARSCTFAGSEIVIKEPKNKSSCRRISVQPVILSMLKDLLVEQKEQSLKMGTAWKGKRGKEFLQNYIFTRDDGTMIYPSSPYNVFKKIVRRYNASLPEGAEPLPEIPLHGLRHTSATLLIAENIDIKTVSERLGHSQTSTTIDTYSHSLRKKDEAAAETLEDILLHKA